MLLLVPTTADGRRNDVAGPWVLEDGSEEPSSFMNTTLSVMSSTRDALGTAAGQASSILEKQLSSLTRDTLNNGRRSWRQFEKSALLELHATVKDHELKDHMGIIVALMILVFVVLILGGVILSLATRLAQHRSRLVEDLEHLSAQLRGPVQKYPTNTAGNDTFLRAWRLQDRYLAVVVSFVDADGKRLSLASGWANAQLCWWESASAYSNAEEPKGQMVISSITEAVQTTREEEVMINYTQDASEHELVLMFHTAKVAEQWRKTLQEFLKVLAALSGSRQRFESASITTSVSEPPTVKPPSQQFLLEDSEDEGDERPQRLGRMRTRTYG